MGGLLSCNQLAHMEELIKIISANSGKPSYAFGRPSSVNAGTWLFSGNSVPSNKTGIPFGLNNGQLIYAWVGNEDLVAYDVEVYYHLGDETSLTLLTTLNISAAARTDTFDITDFGTVNIPNNVQIAAKVSSVAAGNPKNVSIHLTIAGTT